MTMHKGDPLEARLEDYSSFAQKGQISVSGFLTPGEQKRAQRYLSSRGCADQAIFWGGYANAERACLFFLPAFYVEIEDLMPPPDTDPAKTLSDVGDHAVLALRIRGSGFRTLTHRDYLGSLLGLGLERDAVGDIAVQNEHEAIVFCKKSLLSFLLSDLKKVANDTVRCQACQLDEHFTDGRNYQPISATVASARLDCIVAALTDLSREDAQNAVRTGLVEVDFEPVEQTDCILTPPVTLSVRGFGRYVLRAFDGETRKGRIRLRADRLI